MGLGFCGKSRICFAPKPEGGRAASPEDHVVARPSLPVVWTEEGKPRATGQLSLGDGHATLTGASAHDPRQFEFDAAEVEAFELVAVPALRLNGRPTLAITLRGRGRLWIAEAFGFGIVADVADYLRHWRPSDEQPPKTGADAG
jgi:hypothetical protein